MLDDETWIVGESASFFSLKAEVVPTQEPLRAAAFAKDMPKFIHTPKALKEILMEKEQELKEQANLTSEAPIDMETQEEKIEQTTEEVVAEVATEEVAETVAEEAKVEEPVVETAEAVATVEETQPQEEMVAKAEVDKRVSGM